MKRSKLNKNGLLPLHQRWYNHFCVVRNRCCNTWRNRHVPTECGFIEEL